MQHWVIFTPQLKACIILISSPLTMSLALWGMTSDAVDEESNPFLATIVGRHERDRGTVPRQHTVLINLSKRKRVIVLSNARSKPRCCFFCTGTSPHCSELRHPLGQVQFGDGVQMNLHDHNTQQSLTYVTESCARSTASEKYKTGEQTSSGPSASLRQRMPAYLTLVSPLSSHDKLTTRVRQGHASTYNAANTWSEQTPSAPWI